MKTRGLLTVCLASTLVSPVVTHVRLVRGHGGGVWVGRGGSWIHASIEVTMRQHRIKDRDRDMLEISVTLI